MLTTEPTPATEPQRSERDASFANDPRWALVERIVGSPPFERAPRLSQLLVYLARQTLLGNQDRLSESVIAAEVFERSSSFDPAVDTIVRSHMVRLRQKLEQYSMQADPAEHWKVHAPKGSYSLNFFPALLPTAPAPQAPVVVPPSRGQRKLVALCAALGIFCLFLLAVLFFRSHSHPDASVVAQPPAHPLWSLLFHNNQNTTFVAADSGLVALHSLTGSATDLDDYVHHNFTKQLRGFDRNESALYFDVGSRRYTSFVDLTMAQRVLQLPQTRAGRLQVRYARDLTVSDLKTGNWILSGDHGANPWVLLFEPNMNFVERTDPQSGRTYLLNRHPQPGESASYFYSPTHGNRTVFGMLALLPNLSGTGQVLIAGGTSLAGTEAVSDFLFNDAALLPFLKRIERPDGSLPHFEVLLQSNNLNGDAGSFKILASRIYR